MCNMNMTGHDVRTVWIQYSTTSKAVAVSVAMSRATSLCVHPIRIHIHCNALQYAPLHS